MEKQQKNPYRYKGSGKIWKRHIKKNGYDVSTNVIGVFHDPISIQLYALKFSIANKIVESPEWANLVPEIGIDSGANLGMKLGGRKKGCDAWNKGMKRPYRKIPRKNPTKTGNNIAKSKTKSHPIFLLSRNEKESLVNYVKLNENVSAYKVAKHFNLTRGTNFSWSIFKSVLRSIENNTFL